MNYLLIQIFICLLIAGLIGLIIGWFLRGGCKKELRENDNIWDTKLKNTNNTWNDKVQGLMIGKKSMIEKSNRPWEKKIKNMEEKLKIAENKIRELNKNHPIPHTKAIKLIKASMPNNIPPSS